MTATYDDRETIRGIIEQIRAMYREIVTLRNDDRNKYKEMCMRLDALEKDRSLRTKKTKRKLMQLKKQQQKKALSKTKTAKDDEKQDE